MPNASTPLTPVTPPKMGQNLTPQNLSFLKAVAKSCRRSIIEMVKNSQSGHPGGSLSCIDYLALLYSFVISQTGEKVVVSNGHISPGVYAILAEMGYIPKEEAIATFRKIGSVYEGHVTRHVKGVEYGTGPLGIGVSVAAAYALSEKLKAQTEGKPPETARNVYALMGDGEAQEGQVYEMTHFASKYNLNNLVLFVDYNRVQLTASLEEIMPLNLPAIFASAGWNVLEADGHDFEALWACLAMAGSSQKKTSDNTDNTPTVKNSVAIRQDKPTVIIGTTIMGKGVSMMQPEGEAHKATWHGNAPKPEDADKALAEDELTLNPDELAQLSLIKKLVQWTPNEPDFKEDLSPVTLGSTSQPVNTGTPKLYGSSPEELTDCRTAYGQALLELAKLNPQVVAITADLRGSVMTKFVAAELANQHLEAGIAEQNMVSIAGGLSLSGHIPFASTFGAFMSSRAKDQARVNDINHTNVKMVATHCGLSVGEDGPTHQSIDDMSSFLGMFHTMIIEPADPNQCDRIIRYIASRWGNFYVRMGRHKYPVITKADGTPFYGTDYVYEYGKSDVVRTYEDSSSSSNAASSQQNGDAFSLTGTITIAATGAMVHEAVVAWEKLRTENPELKIEVVAVSSIKKFDDTLINSIKKTGRLITVEDHNAVVGLASQLLKHLTEQGICLQKFHGIGVREYQFSGKADQLYAKAGIDSAAIAEACKKI